ncbi:AaceriACR009Wp [[Ashbya] aceris (nom. inval.)]|nr:AaceriACR009Wp [[Ashbya] aceris (nom. inval.)]
MPNKFDGFVPIHCIFYALFHPTEGTKVRFQFPSDSLEKSGIRFDTIKNYVIPKSQLCNKLVTFKFGSYRLVCYPVNIKAPYYARNSFSFNLVFVFPYDSATSPYEPAIARLAKMLRVLEEQSQMLSKVERDPVYYQLKTGETQAAEQKTEENDSKAKTHNLDKQSRAQHNATTKYHEIMKHINSDEKNLYIEDLITKLYEDLNNYSECLIPMDSGNAIDIKLFPLLAPPNSCLSFEDVPIAKVNLMNLVDVNWDPTMLKIVPFINGVNSIAKISKCSDSAVELVMECIKHLVYYDCVALVDMFQFSNIYAPTNLLRDFLFDFILPRECQVYVVSSEDSEIHRLPFESRPNGGHSRNQTASTNTVYTLRRTTSTNRADSFSSNAEFSQKSSGISSLAQSFTQSNKDYYCNRSRNLEPNYKRILPTRRVLFDLYRSLTQGQTVKEWYKANYSAIRENQIDVRRFIIFGVFHRLIYRCYSYPVAKSIGTLELLKRFDYVSTTDNFIPTGTSGNNVFSTSDIRVDFDGSSRSRNIPQFLNTADVAEEVLRETYQKLSIKDILNDSLDPISKGYQAPPENEAAIKDNSRKQSMSTLNTTRITFDIRNRHASKDNENREQNEDIPLLLKKKRLQEFLLLQSVKSVDSFDKIAVRLEMNKQEVERLLKGTGEYNIINS